MAVSTTTRVQISPITAQHIDGRFVGVFNHTVLSTGDGSGGAVTQTFVLGDTLPDSTLFYILTYVSYNIGNTGVTYKARLYANVANINPYQVGYIATGASMAPEYQEILLYDNGVTTCYQNIDVILLGHGVVGAAPQFVIEYGTNTNTKEYLTVVRGFVHKGYPLLPRSLYPV